jgi:GntR family transcriptional regulator, rspAB operon transcriptional repressor
VTSAGMVYRQLKREIVTCKLAPGRCFSEGEFAKRYNSSRPLAATCRRLEHEGLMQIIPFRGYFIAPLTVADFHNLHEPQLIMDPAAAAPAAQRANPGEIVGMGPAVGFRCAARRAHHCGRRRFQSWRQSRPDRR